MKKEKLMYRNMTEKEIPKEDKVLGSPFVNFVNREREKCIKGIPLFDDVKFPGTLYYSWNHTKMAYDSLDEYGNIETRILPPLLRDTDWEIHTAFDACNIERLGLLLGSCRQAGKSEFIACLATHEINFKSNPEVLALFSTKADKQTFAKKLDIHLKHNTKFLTIPNIDKDLNKDLIRFGITKKDNETEVEGKIYMYLTDEGRNTEVAAGKTLSMYLFDEVAKANYLEVNEAVLPAIKTQLAGKTGLKARMFHTFTGGNAEKFGDAKKAFYNPRAYYHKEFDEDKTGLFLDATYRSDLKKLSTLGEFLINKYGRNSGIEEIDSLPMLVKDLERANEILELEYKEAKETSTSAYNKRRMYDPRKKGDMFLTGENNIFSRFASDLEILKDYLVNYGIKNYRTVDFIRNKHTNEVTAIDVDKPILKDYPLSKADLEDLDRPVVIIDEPRKVDRGKLYVMGADLFNVDKTSESASLGSFYVMQRRTNDYTDPFNDRMVAFYNGRKSLGDFQAKLLNTLYYYGAEEGLVTLLHEAANDALTQTYSENYIIHFLEDTYSLARQINEKANSYNTKGLKPTPKNQNYGLERLIEYMEEEMDDGTLGLRRIGDPYLVSQILSFEGDLKPMDALVAFFHTIIHLFKERHYNLVASNRTTSSEDDSKPTVFRRASIVSNRNVTRRRRI